MKDFKRKGNLKKLPNDKLEYKPQKDAGIPTRDYEVNPSFQRRAYKDLTFDAVTMKVDPAGQTAEQADPYAISNRTNQIVDAAYPGSDNTAGSVIPQLAQSPQSTFSDMPDSVQEEIKINMYFCKTNSKSNADVDSDSKGTVNLKMDVPYDDIVNSITAEAYTDLPFFKWTTYGPVYSNDGKLDVLLNYQTVVQTLVNVPLRYRVVRSLEKHLKDMSFYNGSNKMNRIYGTLKKSSFVNQIKSVSESVMGHYLDEYWFNQTSMLVAIPCRKSNSMSDPLIDIIPTYDINSSLEVYADETDAEEHDPDKAIIKMSKFSDLMAKARDFMLNTSPQKLLSMARDPELTTDDINSWFNNLVDDLDVIINDVDEFRTDFADLLVAFKRMSKIGITEWKTGFYLSVDGIDNTYEPKFNKLIFDIVRASFTGSETYEYDARQGKWTILDLWDKYLGISSYNYKSGGCVLTTSTRRIVRTGAPDSAAVPVLFYGATLDGHLDMTVLTRNGNKFTINPDVVTMATGQIARTIGRLIPLTSLNSETFLIPQIDISSLYLSPTKQGWLINMMIGLFGYCDAIVETIEEEGEETVYVHNYSASEDSLCFTDIEIEDQTNAVITFVRQHSPFRVVKTTLRPVLGFTTSSK